VKLFALNTFGTARTNGSRLACAQRLKVDGELLGDDPLGGTRTRRPPNGFQTAAGRNRRWQISQSQSK
jgi:hypothetical protein